MFLRAVIICLIFLFEVTSCFAQELIGKLNLPSRHQQIVWVTTDNWEATRGTLQLYEKESNQWKPVGKQVEVVIGRSGLAWGRGLNKLNLPGPEKKEGDGKAPAGIFEFGEAFGYHATPPEGVKIPYRQATSRDYWVDAPEAPDYNTWVSIPDDKENNPKKYWSSYERMKRADHLYELGVIVKHNMNPVVAGKGSAIFFHLWRNPGAPTAGCTAMSKEDLLNLLKWIDEKKYPLLIQAPREEVGKILADGF